MAQSKIVRAAQRAINMQKEPRAKSVGSNIVQSLTTIKDRIVRATRNAVAVIIKNQASDYFYFGELDNLPNSIIATVDNSGTAIACIGRLEQFTKADGFIQAGLDGRLVNKKQSLAALVDDIVTNVSYLDGLALRLIFNNAGQVCKLYCLPISTLRRKADGFEYNPLMGEVGKLEQDTRFYPEFDPERTPEARLELITKQIKKNKEQLGEVLYIFRKGLGRYYDIYPVPRYYASIEDIVSDGKISRLDLRNIAQGFRTPVVISTGPIDDQNADEDGKTPQDYFDESLENFTGEDASPILHLKGSTEEFKPTVTVINLAEILDQTDRASERIAKRVARIMEVPAILVGLGEGGKLGDVQEVKNQMALFALSVYKKQDLIKQAFDSLAPYFAADLFPAGTDFTLSTLKPFEFIPDSVLAKLTTEELKEIFEINLEGADLAGVPALPAAAPIAEPQAQERNDALANLTGRQLQNIQRIVRKFNKDELTYEQAALMLKQGFNLSDDDAAIWLVTKDEEEQNI